MNHSAVEKLRILVAGAGHLGSFHAQKISEHPGAQLAGIYDIHFEKAQVLAAKHGVPALREAHAVPCDAMVVSTTTQSHAEVACKALNAGLHVLVEKPIAPTLSEAQAIIDCAEKNQRIVCVGHTERFNPAVAAAMQLAGAPRYITSERLSPFSGRSLDVDVILDLMIHDLDVLASLVKAPLKDVRAVGVPVLTRSVDMASARLEFADGCVAELQAGRVSMEPCRKIRFFTSERYVSVDCGARTVKSVRMAPPLDGQEMGSVCGEPVEVGEQDPLYAQLDDFLRGIRAKKPVRVDGRAGYRALELAHAVKAVMTNPGTAP